MANMINSTTAETITAKLAAQPRHYLASSYTIDNPGVLVRLTGARINRKASHQGTVKQQDDGRVFFGASVAADASWVKRVVDADGKPVRPAQYTLARPTVDFDLPQEFIDTFYDDQGMMRSGDNRLWFDVQFSQAVSFDVQGNRQGGRTPIELMAHLRAGGAAELIGVVSLVPNAEPITFQRGTAHEYIAEPGTVLKMRVQVVNVKLTPFSRSQQHLTAEFDKLLNQIEEDVFNPAIGGGESVDIDDEPATRVETPAQFALSAVQQAAAAVTTVKKGRKLPTA